MIDLTNDTHSAPASEPERETPSHPRLSASIFVTKVRANVLLAAKHRGVLHVMTPARIFAHGCGTRVSIAA